MCQNEKMCLSCGEKKPLDEFSRAGYGHYRTRCKDCVIGRSRLAYTQTIIDTAPVRYVREFRLPTRISNGRDAAQYYIGWGIVAQIRNGRFNGDCGTFDESITVVYSSATHRYVLKKGKTVIGGFTNIFGEFIPN